jgi:hypothetical protein
MNLIARSHINVLSYSIVALSAIFMYPKPIRSLLLVPKILCPFVAVRFYSRRNVNYLIISHDMTLNIYVTVVTVSTQMS